MGYNKNKNYVFDKEKYYKWLNSIGEKEKVRTWTNEVMDIPIIITSENIGHVIGKDGMRYTIIYKWSKEIK